MLSITASEMGPECEGKKWSEKKFSLVSPSLTFGKTLTRFCRKTIFHPITKFHPHSRLKRAYFDTVYYFVIPTRRKKKKVLRIRLEFSSHRSPPPHQSFRLRFFSFSCSPRSSSPPSFSTTFFFFIRFHTSM